MNVVQPPVDRSVVRQYKDRLIAELNLEMLLKLPDDEQRHRISSTLRKMFFDDKLILKETEREILIKQVLEETVGLGPLEELLRDPDITEIMIDGPDELYYEKQGRLHDARSVRFQDDQHLLRIIDKIVMTIGRRIDDASPMVDARLPDGSRVHAAIPPVAALPTVTIRKFRPTPWRLEDFRQANSLSSGMCTFLHAAIESRLNIVVFGPTGSGKTSLLSALLKEVGEDERLVIMEDMAEIKLERRRTIRLEGRPPNLEGKGEITLRSLIRHALRMRPDRIIIGEVRGEEALDMLRALNTGHRGLTSLHAESPRDAITRLEQMVLMAGTEMPLKAIENLVDHSIHLLVQSARLKDGARKVVSICSVAERMVQPLFRFRSLENSRSLVTGTFEQVATDADLHAVLQTGEGES